MTGMIHRGRVTVKTRISNFADEILVAGKQRGKPQCFAREASLRLVTHLLKKLKSRFRIAQCL